MSTSVNEVDSWYKYLKEQALINNDKNVVIWSNYKNDLESAKSLLSLIPKKLKHEVMVPIGPKALMRGKIVHTNEFLVNLGETWFAKRTANQAVDICNRRIKTCEEMLKKLEKEKELIVNKTDLPAEQEAFGSEERPEIIEYVTEEENEEWMKQHRNKEKEYRKKLQELREKEKKPIETEEDLWKHLDELELQEELEDELNRLNAECSSDEDVSNEISSEQPNENSTPVNSESDELVGNKEAENPVVKKDTVNYFKPKRKVSYACETESSDDEPLKLEIHHSDIQPISSDPNSVEINSPSDIYERYLSSVSRTPLSILKNNVNPNKEKELKMVKCVENMESSEDEVESSVHLSEGIIVKDVTERHSFNEKYVKGNEKQKKISEFKASRRKKV